MWIIFKNVRFYSLSFEDFILFILLYLHYYQDSAIITMFCVIKGLGLGCLHIYYAFDRLFQTLQHCLSVYTLSILQTLQLMDLKYRLRNAFKLVFLVCVVVWIQPAVTLQSVAV